ncbi:MAG: insulinase family protein [Nannocystaceae bacterium]
MSALRKAADAPQGRTRSWLAGGVLSAAIAAAAAATLLRDQGEAAPTPTQAPTATQDATDPWAEIVAASNLPPTIAQPLQGDPTALTLHRLRNGLSIYVVNRPTEPFVSSAIIIRAGSKEEGEQHQGIAPLVMHTVMQGTERLGVIDPSLERPQLVLQHALLEKLPRVDDVRARDVMLRAISAAERSAATVLGGQEFFGAASALGAREPGVFNGHGTQILIDVPRHRFGAWVSLTAEALRRPVFRNFLGTVAQELELGSWRAEGSRADLELFRALRDATGIVFDHEAAIAELSRIPFAEAQQFYADYYRPNNIAFVLVGDITAEEALPLFEQQFGDWEPAPIPRSSTVERPLTAPRTVIQIEDSGPPRAELAWAMPVPGTPEHADLLALNDALPGPGGLLGTAIDAAGMSGGSYAAPMRDFRVAVFPGPGQTLREAETLAFDALKRVADDRVSDEAWARALARASLERNAWARSTPMLIERIADSYLDARPWADVAHELAGPPATRARMIGAAKRLVSQGYVVVHKDAGKPWRLEVPKLPVERRKPTFGQHSPFVQSLLDAPATPMEPRFLVEGSHYRSRAYGKGRLITTAADGPLYRAVWIFPLGTAEDAWVCDAFQAALHRLPVDDVDVWVDCSTADTRVILLGNAADRAVSMPKLTSWLLETPLDSAHARDWAELAVQWRSDYRNDVIALEHAFHAWALRGEYGLDAQLPDDDAMRRDAVRELPRALAAARARDPDVLYVGPDVDGFIAGLPRPRGQRGGPLPQRRYRELESPTVFVLHDPHRQDASVRVAVPWLARTTRDALVGRIHAHTAWMNSFGIDPRLEAQWLEYDVRWSPTDPLAVGVGYRAEDEDVAFAIRTALTALRARPQAKQFDEARSFLEVSYRGYRVPQRRVPEHVRSWGPDASDPRVAQWLALPGLAMDDIDEYFARVDATTPVISVVVNLDRFDTATLAEFGKVIVLRDHGLLRDPMLTELGADAPMQRINE